MLTRYGHIPKAVMSDSRLSLEARAIYAYFATFAGSGSVAFPSRGRILADLGIAKNTYYRHLKLLIVLEYVAITTVRNRQGVGVCNRYNLNKQACYGFGVLPQAVMTDSRLSLKAKGLFAFFCATASGGSVASPNSTKSILPQLGISENTYYKLLKELTDAKLIVALVARRQATRYLIVSTDSNNNHKIYDVKNCDCNKKTVINKSFIKNNDKIKKTISNVIDVDTQVVVSAVANITRFASYRVCGVTYSREHINSQLSRLSEQEKYDTFVADVVNKYKAAVKTSNIIRPRAYLNSIIVNGLFDIIACKQVNNDSLILTALRARRSVTGQFV